MCFKHTACCCLYVLCHSGHGGQVMDVTGDEEDQLDETWCLYDGQLIDDELYLELSKFAEGVRILVLSDSCHSGTMTRAGPPPSVEPAGKPVVYRQLPPVLGQQVYQAHADFYDNLQKQISAKARQQPLKEFTKGKVATLMLHPRLVTSERYEGGGSMMPVHDACSAMTITGKRLTSDEALVVSSYLARLALQSAVTSRRKWFMYAVVGWHEQSTSAL